MNVEKSRIKKERRYPVKRTVYMQTVGKLLPRRIRQILKELGFDVWVNPKQGNGIDIKVWYEKSLILVGEILNWSIGSRLSEKRHTNMISNLAKYDCRRILIYTTLDQKSLPQFIKNGIDTLELGYQILPRYYYYFFSSKGQIEKRKIDSAMTKKEIKNKMLSYIKKHFLHIGI